MKKSFITLALLILAAGISAQHDERAPRSPFGNLGLSLNAGLTGFGASLSTPIGKHFTARAGFGTLPFSYRYTDALSFNISEKLAEHGLNDVQIDQTIDHEIDLKGKLNVPAGHLLVDYTPFKQGLGSFHLTAGIYVGGSNLVHVNGNTNLDRLQQKIDGIKNEIDAQYPGAGANLDINARDFALEVGGENIRLNTDGTVDAYAKVNNIKPYFGIGWGNAIPKGRVGFRFDIGALYHGKPEITSPNIDQNLHSEINSNEVLNDIIKYAHFWPQLSFQLTFRLF